MTNISIQDKDCWMCGSKENLTVHHGLPSHLKSKKNITIPVCRGCHDRIHFDDVNGMYSYIHKIEKVLNNGLRDINVLKKMVDENTKLKEVKTGKKVTL